MICDIYECANKTSGLYVDRNFIKSSQDYRLLFLILENSILLVVLLVTIYVYQYIVYVRYIYCYIFYMNEGLIINCLSSSRSSPLSEI